MVQSQVQAQHAQCRQTIRLGILPLVGSDNANSARQIAETGDPTRGAIASRLAAEIREIYLG